MKILVAMICAVGLAGTAVAQERMTRTICQESFERTSELFDPANPDLALQLQFLRVTGDGWCHIRGSDPGFDEASFTDLHWRMQDSARWTDQGIPPLALEFRILGLEPDEMDGSAGSMRPQVDVEITLRQDPDAGTVILERAVMDNGAGDSFSMSGVFERVFLSSPSMMQVSMGSATFKAGLMVLTLDGTHENPFGFEANVEIEGDAQARIEGIFEVLSTLPDGVIDDASRAELTAFAGDLPKPVGTLEVSVASERGLGLVQVEIVAAMMAEDAFDTGPNERSDSPMEILFDGLTVSANWSPAAQVAD